jgi:hypothetical protein
MNTHYEKIIGYLAGLVVLALIVWGVATSNRCGSKLDGIKPQSVS